MVFHPRLTFQSKERREKQKQDNELEKAIGRVSWGSNTGEAEMQEIWQLLKVFV